MRVALTGAGLMTKERIDISCTGYMGEDEVIEVTPSSIRLRKATLDASLRERQARAKAKQIRAGKDKRP